MSKNDQQDLTWSGCSQDKLVRESITLFSACSPQREREFRDQWEGEKSD